MNQSGARNLYSGKIIEISLQAVDLIKGTFTFDGVTSGTWKVDNGIKGYYQLSDFETSQNNTIRFKETLVQDNGSIFGTVDGIYYDTSGLSAGKVSDGTFKVEEKNGKYAFKNYRNGILLGEGYITPQTFGYLSPQNYKDLIKGKWISTDVQTGYWTIDNSLKKGFFRPGTAESTVDLYLDSNDNGTFDKSDYKVGLAVAAPGTIDIKGTWNFSPSVNLGDYFNSGGKDVGLVVLTDTSFLPNAYKTQNEYGTASLSGNELKDNTLLTGNSYDYKFYNLGYGRYGIQQKGKSTIDEITGVTTMQFQDQAISLAKDVAATFNQVKGIDDASGVVFRLYNAAFARLPDADGLKYWISQYSSDNLDYKKVAQSFLSSNEFALKYGVSNSNNDFVNNLYKNILGRSADQTGLQYWVNNLNQGINSRAEVLGGFSESLENKNLFSQTTGFS